MPNVLTAAKAANFIRSTSDDAVMLQFLPLIDAYLLNATGHDWAADSSIHPSAELAAGMLLVYWYDHPSLVGQSPSAMAATLVQLEAEALKYRKYVIFGISGAGLVSLPGARIGDQVIKVTGVYGVTGNQAASFATVISDDDQIEQLNDGDLSDNQYAVVLKHPAEDVSA